MTRSPRNRSAIKVGGKKNYWSSNYIHVHTIAGQCNDKISISISFNFVRIFARTYGDHVAQDFADIGDSGETATEHHWGYVQVHLRSIEFGDILRRGRDLDT